MESSDPNVTETDAPAKGGVSGAARSTWTHVLFGFLAMGAWAAFANREHGGLAMAYAFVVQGTLSGLLTLALKRWLETAFQSLMADWPMLPRRLTPPIISCVIIGTALFLAHRLAGTPEIIATIAVPWSVSTLYAFLYTATLAPLRNDP